MSMASNQASGVKTSLVLGRLCPLESPAKPTHYRRINPTKGIGNGLETRTMRKTLSSLIDQLLNIYYRLRWKWLSRKLRGWRS